MTDTLNDALLQLGERLANNLIEQGINASAEEGLTTLADKVLEIEGGGGEEEEMQTITINLQWDDNNNADLNRPENVKVRLYQDGVEADYCVLNSANGWAYTFTDLPKFNNDKLIHYSITADSVDYYLTTIQGFTIHEKYSPVTTSLTVTKIWNDYDDALGNRPLSIAMTLNNGMVVMLSAENGWSATIPDLPVYIDGEVFDYTWSEQEIRNYQIESMTTIGNVTTFTNKPWKVIKPGMKDDDGEELEGSDISSP